MKNDSKKILQKWLKDNGYDGLAMKDCGCGLDDLIPCGNSFEDCIPARKQMCSDCKLGIVDCEFEHISFQGCYFAAKEKEVKP